MPKKVVFCSICGVSSEEKNVSKRKIYGDYLCEKHYIQYKNHGKFFDNNSRGVFDPNDIRMFEEYAEIDTYDQYGNVVTTFKIDLDDVEKLGDKKWRTVFKNDKPYLFTGNQNSERVYFHRLAMNNPKLQIDHISGDTSDNRKCNLRIVSIQENMLNLQKKSDNTSGFRGVSFDSKRNNWKVDFTYKKQRFYLKQYPKKEQAIYLRYLLETTFLKEYRNKANDKAFLESINLLSDEEKKEIELYLNEKLNSMKVGV